MCNSQNGCGNAAESKSLVEVIKDQFVDAVVKIKAFAVSYKIGKLRKVSKEIVNTYFDATSEVIDDVADVSYGIFEDIVKSPKLMRVVAKSMVAGKTMYNKFERDRNVKAVIMLGNIVAEYEEQKIADVEEKAITTDELLAEARKLISSGDIDSGILDYIKKTREKNDRFNALKFNAFKFNGSVILSAEEIEAAINDEQPGLDIDDELIVVRKTIRVSKKELKAKLAECEKEIAQAKKE